MSRVTSVRLSEELASRVEGLAAALDHPKGWVIEQAVARYVEQEAWQVQAIKEAVDAYHEEKATGHVAGRDFDEVMSELDAKIRAKLPSQ